MIYNKDRYVEIKENTKVANEKKIDCAILGLLSHEPMTGYDIKKCIDVSLSFFWGASYGSIYPTLNHLVTQGMVTKKESKENGRDKIFYTITDKGRERLRKWLVQPIEKDELRFETMLKVFLGGEIGIAGTIEHIERFEAKASSELTILKECVDQLEALLDEDEDHLYYLLTAKFGVKIYQSYLEWCKEANKLLKNKKK